MKINHQKITEFVLNGLATSDRPLNDFELQHQFSLCEIISEDEVYSLRRNPDYLPENPKSSPFIRANRICGHLRVKDGRKLRCLCPAGFSTNHAGWGKCHIHDVHSIRGTNRNINLLKGYRKSGLALEMSELFDTVPEILNDPALYDVEDEIHVLNMLLLHQINSPTVSSYEIRKTIDCIVKAKVARQRIKTEKLLIDVTSIKTFVNAIFEVLRRNLGTAQYSKIAKQIEESAYFPINKPMQIMLNAELGEKYGNKT